MTEIITVWAPATSSTGYNDVIGWKSSISLIVIPTFIYLPGPNVQGLLILDRFKLWYSRRMPMTSIRGHYEVIPSKSLIGFIPTTSSRFKPTFNCLSNSARVKWSRSLYIEINAYDFVRSFVLYHPTSNFHNRYSLIAHTYCYDQQSIFIQEI